MTDKDHEDMTASELLRSGNSICGLCMMLTDGDCMNHGCLDIFTTLANKIDAEIVKAYSEKLNTCAMRWAKANGWPDFKDGEDFGAWLNRCALKLPCDKDGEPWHIDNRVCPSNTGETTVVGYIFDKETCYLKLRWCGEDGRANDLASMCKRPAPEVLGADGKPLNEDDTVYGTGREQHRYTVQVPYSINEAVGQRFCVQCYGPEGYCPSCGAKVAAVGIMRLVTLYDEEGAEGIECSKCGWSEIHGWDEPMPGHCPWCGAKVAG